MLLYAALGAVGRAYASFCSVVMAVEAYASFCSVVIVEVVYASLLSVVIVESALFCSVVMA